MLRTVAVHIVDIAFHVVVAFGERTHVTVEQIDVPRNDGYRARPVKPVVRAVSPSVGGDDVGQHTVGLLLVAVVGEPLLVHCYGVVVVESRLYGEMAVARPSVLLALRTVCRVAHKVGYVCHACRLHGLVEQRFGRGYASRRLHIAVCEVRRDVA